MIFLLEHFVRGIVSLGHDYVHDICPWHFISWFLSGPRTRSNLIKMEYATYYTTVSHCFYIQLQYKLTSDCRVRIQNSPWTIIVAAGCGDLSYYGPSGVITSPNHPSNYENNLNCDYDVYASTGSSLSFIFNSFYTEEQADFVRVSILRICYSSFKLFS